MFVNTEFTLLECYTKCEQHSLYGFAKADTRKKEVPTGYKFEQMVEFKNGKYFLKRKYKK